MDTQLLIAGTYYYEIANYKNMANKHAQQKTMNYDYELWLWIVYIVFLESTAG